LLEQCRESVRQQTYPVKHYVFADVRKEGPQKTRNQLLAELGEEWVLPLDDDDVLDPGCVERLIEAVDQDPSVDVAYPWCRMEGRTDGWTPNKLFSPNALFRQNFIPVTALIRTDMLRMVGGYQEVPMEDWMLWQWLYLHGARFVCVPEVLWTYRHHAEQNFQRQAA
jgi:glycosyltransferase involved in cell wall biosynthesis